MMEKAKFNIGDRVVTELGPGTIEAVYTRNHGCYAYVVCLDDTGSGVLFFEEELDLERKEYSMDIKIDIADNVVIATLYESVGGVQKPLNKGHGHLIHEGEFGIAQAASYACYRLWKSMEVAKR